MNYQPHQPPKTFNFPETVYGKQKGPFQHHWFQKYSCLDYDVEEDSVTYVFWKRQNSDLLSERCKEETFSNQVTKSEKKPLKSLTRTSSLNFTSLSLNYEVITPQCRNTLEMIDKNEKKHRKLNRHIFLTILGILQYLSRQVLVVRGDDDDESKFDCNQRQSLNSQVDYQKR